MHAGAPANIDNPKWDFTGADVDQARLPPLARAKRVGSATAPFAGRLTSYPAPDRPRAPAGLSAAHDDGAAARHGVLSAAGRSARRPALLGRRVARCEPCTRPPRAPLRHALEVVSGSPARARPAGGPKPYQMVLSALRGSLRCDTPTLQRYRFLRSLPLHEQPAASRSECARAFATATARLEALNISCCQALRAKGMRHVREQTYSGAGFRPF